MSLLTERELTERLVTGLNMVKKSAEVGATTATLWTPTSGTRFVLTEIILSVTDASTVTVFDATDTTANRICKLALAANGGTVIDLKTPVRASAIDGLLRVTNSAGTCYITVIGYEE